MKRNCMKICALAVLAVVLPSAMSFGQAASAKEANAPSGIVPIPDYSGSIWERNNLMGDWGGSRTEWANKGIQLDTNLTQSFQSVVVGGISKDSAYNMSLDHVLSVDLDRMGVVPGGLFVLRLESRYGGSVNDVSGVLLPVNTDALFPLTSPLDDGITTITEASYVQFLSKEFGVLLGKMQTADGDLNEFASGRGIHQFMNYNFIFNGVVALTVPYSTLGGGAIWMPTDKITVSSILMGTSDTSTTTGFDELNQGLTWTTSLEYQYALGELPGGATVTAIYAFAGDYKDIDSTLQFSEQNGLSFPSSSSTWSVFANAWQYVYTMDKAPEKINLEDGRPDVRGIGFFGRIGYADESANPINWSSSIGLGGRGLIPSRNDDTIGVGYVYTELTNPDRRIATRLAGSTQAVEAFYNVALTPAMNLTFDIQWADGPFNRIDQATIIGARLNVEF